MTATSLGLGGTPATFRGAYIVNLNSSLGLAQSPSTCSLTLVEDDCISPPALFNPPEMAEFVEVNVGQFDFAGVVTGYQTDVVNIGGRQITVSISDPREIMKSIPIIIAPGYRTVAQTIGTTGCSVIDVYGAYDNAGLNFSGWNQAGITYERIANAFKGGAVNIGTINFNVPTQLGKAFGTTYFFNLDEITSKVDPAYRINSNLISVADLIQELASKHSFDWFVESTLNIPQGRVDVIVKTIDRSVDNTDIDLDTFLAANSGFVTAAQRGYELRNEVSCAVLLGAPIESLRAVTVNGMANNPIDLSDEGGSDKYYMVEDEMRFVLGGKGSWTQWLDQNGGLNRYSVGGSTKLSVLWKATDASDLGNQLGISTVRASISNSDEDTVGRIFEKLQGHAKATYGKRFMFSQIIFGGAEAISAAWTADTVAGNNDPNEYFRNEDGKTRCYVEFFPSNALTPSVGNPPSFVFGLGANAPQPLPLSLRNSFNAQKAITELDKSDWIVKNGALYVAATIEEGGVVRIDSPVVLGLPNTNEGVESVANAGPAGSITNANGDKSKGDHNTAVRSLLKGESVLNVHSNAYQPRRAFIPTKDKFLRYGPVFASNLSASAEGKLEIEQDDGFAPWEFGGFTTMIDAMQFKVDNSSSQIKTVESATIAIEGFPKFSIGESLGFNSNINNISISFGDGVSTTYELRSFLREFGELSKEELALFSLFARRSGARTLAQDTVSFINRYRAIISKQFSGRGSSSSSATFGGAANFE